MRPLLMGVAVLATLGLVVIPSAEAKSVSYSAETSQRPEVADGPSEVAASKLPEPARKVVCGEDQVFGRSFTVEVRGRPLKCGKVRKVIDARCRIRPKHEWSCFSFQVDDPFIVWFRSREMFKRRWSTAIVYRRYPCTEATLDGELFRRETNRFPTPQQLLADDLIRCDLLASKTFAEVRRLLGPPAERKSGRYLVYDLGPERDSFFQIDDEFLYVSFSRSGMVSATDIFQG